MCGRYALFTLSPELIREILGFVPIDEHGLILPRWNIAPTQRALVVRTGPDGRRSLDELRWGLVPSWADDLKTGAKMINARAETIATKPAFRAAFKSRRCLVPASWFYEWKAQDGAKQPYRIGVAGESVFAMAGLWERWQPRQGDAVESFTIVTTAASDAVRSLHDRMPVILPRDAWAAWLDPANHATSALARLLVPFAGPLEVRRIAPTINDARRDEAPVDV